MANSSSYVNLLQSQHPVDLDSPEPFWFGSQGPDEAYVMSGSQVPDASAVKSTPQVSERGNGLPKRIISPLVHGLTPVKTRS